MSNVRCYCDWDFPTAEDRDDHLKNCWVWSQIDAHVKQERERCAKIAESHDMHDRETLVVAKIANEIRKGLV